LKRYKLDTIDHISICVNSINASVQWYLDNYKCDLIYSDSSWAFLRFDNIKLALVANAEHPPHIAVLDDSVVEDPSCMEHRDGSISVYKKDIDRNFIEHITYKKS
tara:strand:- start:2301 stop:2615 length:315 start_codon:yes stop_codon:yes gene_type:complete